LGKRLELIKEIAPKVSRVAVLWNPASPIEPFALGDLLAVAGAAGVEIQSVEARTPDDYPAALAIVAERQADALYPLANIAAWKNRQMIADFALKSRLPSICEERVFVEAGGLLSYGPSFADLYRRAATYVDKILKGANPGDLPIQQPTKLELVINAKAAKALGLMISETLRLRADEVI
jgi:putative ABC transport system substrate-binding protein